MIQTILMLAAVIACLELTKALLFDTDRGSP